MIRFALMAALAAAVLTPSPADCPATHVLGADYLHPALPRPRDALRRGRGERPGRPAVDRADDGGVDARLVPGARVRAPRRAGRGQGARRRRARRHQDAEEPLARRGQGRAARHRDLQGLRPRDVGAHQLDRIAVRAAERRADVPDPGGARRDAAARGGAVAPGRVEDQRDQPGAGRRRGAPLPAPPATTSWSTRRSSPATPPSIASRSAASRTCSPTKAKRGCSTASGRRPTSPGSSPSTSGSGAACPTSATPSSTCSARRAAASSTRIRPC